MTKNVLVIATWGIGNTIQLTPTIQAIHDLGFTIDLFVNPVFSDQYDLLENWSVINKIYLFPRSEPDFKKYDYLVYHHPARTEKFSRYKDWKFSHKTIQNSHHDPFWGGEIYANLELAIKLGMSPSSPIPKCHIEVNEKFDFPDFKKHIVLAPTTHSNKDLWEPKYWHYWNIFIKSLAESNPDWAFWLVGTEKDSNIPPSYSYSNLFNKIGKLTIKQTASLIKGCDLVLCNETGIGWIADALDIPCITLWTCTNMKKNWPQSKERIVVFKKVCIFQPCHHQTRIPGLFCPFIKAKKKHKCGYSFSQEQIWNLMIKILKRKGEI